MTATWEVVPNDHLDEALLDGASSVIQAWFPDDAATVVSAEVFRWKLGDANPGGRGHMTVAVHDGRVVSVVSVTPRRFRVEGVDVRGAEVGDTYTDTAFLRDGSASVPWRGDVDGTHYLSRSAFGRLATETLSRSDEAGTRLYFGVANESAFKAWVGRLGFSRWEGDPLLAYTRLGAAGLGRRLGPARAFGRVAQRVHAAAMLAGIRLAGCTVEELPLAALADVANPLWERVRDRRRIEPVRDGAWFDFRYTQHPDAWYRAWRVRRRGTDAGVFVTSERSDTLGRQVVLLADQLLDEEAVAYTLPFRRAAAGLGTATTDLASCWLQRPWPPHRRLPLATFVTHRPGLIVRTNPGAPLDLTGAPTLEVAMGTSDNV